MPRHSVACRQRLKSSKKYATYSKWLKILGISCNARQRPGKFWNLAQIVWVQPLSRHYMECRSDDRHFLWRFRGSWMFAFSFCYDFVLFIFWRKHNNNNQNGAISFCWHVINKWHWLVHKNPANETSTSVWCKCCAAARNKNVNMDCSGNAALRPNVRFASATHARTLHAHDKPWLLWKTRKRQRARTWVTSHAVTKSGGP